MAISNLVQQIKIDHIISKASAEAAPHLPRDSRCRCPACAAIACASYSEHIEALDEQVLLAAEEPVAPGAPMEKPLQQPCAVAEPPAEVSAQAYRSQGFEARVPWCRSSIVHNRTLNITLKASCACWTISLFGTSCATSLALSNDESMLTYEC